MDLAESIRENTKAVQALTALLERALASPINLAPERPAAIDAEAREVPQPDPQPQAPKPQASKPKAAPKAAPKTPEGPTLDDAKKAAIALVKHDREALVNVLMTFDAPQVALLKPEQYADFIAKCEGKLAELAAEGAE